MKKRAVIFSLAYFPHVGGAEVAVKEITDRVGDYDWDIITARFGSEPQIEHRGRVQVVRVGNPHLGPLNKILYPLFAVRAALRRHRESPYALSWVIMAAYAGIAGVAFSFLIPRVPYVLTLQEGDPLDFIERRMIIVWPLFTRIFTRARSVQAISSFLAAWAKRRGARQVTVIPNGADLARFENIDRRAARRALSIGEDERVIVTASRLVHKNGIDLVIRALPSVPDVLFVIAGGGPRASELQELACTCGVSDRVRFLGDVPYSNVHQIVAAGDVFVRASRSEGMGNAFIEAMAAGVPVIGTSVGGIPDFLTDARVYPTKGTGFVVPPEDVPALVRALQKMFSDHALRSALVGRARDFVRGRFAWDTVAEAIRTVFRDAQIPPILPEKILIATGLYPPDIGGPATYAKFLHDALPAEGITPTVLPFSTVRRLPPIIRHLAYFFLLLVRSRDTDVIFTQDAVSTGVPSMLVSFLFQKPLVMRLAGDFAWEQGVQRFGVTASLDEFVRAESYSFPVSMMRAIQTYTALRAHTIITPSAYMKKIITAWGVPAERITIIPNPVPHEEIPSKRLIRGILRAEGTLMMSVGRLVPWKGFAALIDALPALRRDIPDLTLIITGTGPDFADLERRAISRGVANQVIFTGALSHDILMRYVRAADVFVLNTGFESFSFQIIEAMQVGVPVVTTAVGSLPEVVVSGENGLLVPYGDQRALIDAIKRVVLDDALALKLVRAGKKTAERFLPERVLPAFLAVLKRYARS